jgi:mono/diheme cytochrome c family protein
MCSVGEWRLSLAAAVALTATAMFAAEPDGAAFFEAKIRPLLAQQCLACHSASSNPVMGGLRLDSRDALLQGGSRGPSIVPGKPEQSLLLRAVRHTEGKLQMPPGGKLKDADIAVLAHWIQQGAPWGAQPAAAAKAEKYWAFVPPVDPAAPAVKNRDWVKSPVDAFILAALEAKGLTPVRAADKRTLIRRVTFDLTGLPPTPAEVRAFLDDPAPDAFARVVDRLLASPRYGERWGRHWLDTARYADSNGLDENLVYKNAFRYRDYVIQAFNQDKPYDRFIHEQLAGDLLPPAGDLATTFERWTATGFLSLGAKMLAEDDPVKMEMDIVDEQLDTVSRTFMGLTVGCARCHDHKFDPIPQADYYSMAGIFKSSKTMENFKVVAKWHEFVLAPKEDRDRLEAHEARIEAKKKESARITRAQDEKLVSEAMQKIGAYLMAAHDVDESDRIHLKPALDYPGAVVREAASFDSGNIPRKLEQKKANVPRGAKGPFFAEYFVTVAKAGDYQVDLLDEEKGAGTADLWIGGTLVKRGAEPVENREASADSGGWSAAGIFPLNAGRNTIRLEDKSRFPYFAKLLVAPNTLPAGTPLPRTTVQIARSHGVNPSFLEQMVDHLRRSQGAPASALYAWEVFGKSWSEWKSPVAKLFQNFQPSTRAALAAEYQRLFLEAQSQAAPAGAGLEALRQLLHEKFGPFRAPADAKQYYPSDTQQELTRLEQEEKELEAGTPDFPRAMGVCESGAAADLPIHIRGSHWTLGATVPRRFLRAISGENQPPIGGQASGRLELAQWLTQKDHPLTSRVMVNRIWRWHFGRGIVPSVDNFGRLGEKPVNQPLLDWLALRFIDGGWSIKSMHRLILLSNTYQLSSDYQERGAELDPENTLLWRASRRRLEVEAIRDAIMAVSGGLDVTAGGSILKYKDRQYVANTSRRGDIDYDRPVRAVYIPVIRSSMYDVFRAFDLPDPSTPNGDRDSTVVAPQALFMMNGSVVLRHSRRMAESLLALSGVDDAGRIRDAYERALARPPSPSEVDRGLTFFAQVEQALRDRQKDDAERRILAWQSFCKALIATNEFIYLN